MPWPGRMLVHLADKKLPNNNQALEMQTCFILHYFEQV